MVVRTKHPAQYYLRSIKLFNQCNLSPYSPTILKNIIRLFLQDFVILNVTQLLIGQTIRFSQSEAVLHSKAANCTKIWRKIQWKILRIVGEYGPRSSNDHGNRKSSQTLLKKYRMFFRSIFLLSQNCFLRFQKIKPSLRKVEDMEVPLKDIRTDRKACSRILFRNYASFLKTLYILMAPKGNISNIVSDK